MTYTVLSNIILKRMHVCTDEIVGDWQCGFHPHRSTTEHHIFVVRQMMEKGCKYNTDLHMLSIDVRKAVDSIDKNQPLIALEYYGIQWKIVKLTKITLNHNTPKVLVANNGSRPFNITWLRQGDILYATLFNVALNMVLGEILEKESNQYCLQIALNLCLCWWHCFGH